MRANELNFRTEDLTLEEVGHFFVETPFDRQTIETLKSKKTVVLQGARGVGKSFLLKVAQKELDEEISDSRILAVYLTFNKAGLLQTADPERFKHWMLAKICNRIIREARKKGLIGKQTSIFSTLSRDGDDGTVELRLLDLVTKLEEAWKHSEAFEQIDSQIDPEMIKDAVEDLCDIAGVRRMVLLIDEAAHVFIPEQQRQFFTLMRDLRSPYLSVKAAVYPGVTYFGESFQISHDAELINIHRDILDSNYPNSMREIVIRQDSSLESHINKYGEAFDALAFAASGNPRVLLKTVSSAFPFNTNNVRRVMREYYRETIWGEHSALGDRYVGHRQVIDWGRQFVQSEVIPMLGRRNRVSEEGEGDRRIFIWIHRDAPAAVKEALRLLCYSGILHEAGSGLVATRGLTGARYMLNVGTRVVSSDDPIAASTWLRKSISIKRMVEFGANHDLYEGIARLDLDQMDEGRRELIKSQLDRSVDDLDLTVFARDRLKGLEFDTVRKILAASENDFQRAKWVGPVRSRQMMNVATAAVLEYLSG